jgi:hypothetical protein
MKTKFNQNLKSSLSGLTLIITYLAFFAMSLTWMSCPNPNGNDNNKENDISKLTGRLWIYDYWSNDHKYFSVFQFNSDFTVYEGKVPGSLSETAMVFPLKGGDYIEITLIHDEHYFHSFYYEELHERFILNYYTKSVIQTFEWGEVTYIVKDDVITLSNGVELHRLVYSEPPSLDIVSLSTTSDNPTQPPFGMWISFQWEDNEFLFTGINGASEPNAEIEVGIETIYGISIIARGVADADGSFRVAMPPMPTGFLIGTNNNVLLFAKAPGKDRSLSINYVATFLLRYMNN